jgi:hypothetical protein
MRFSTYIIGLLILIVILIGLTLRFSGPIVASLIFTTTLVIVLSGVVAAFVTSDDTRVFWRGFSVFAGVYFVLVMFHGGQWVIATLHEDPNVQPRRPCFVTAYIAAWAYDRVGGEEIRTGGGSHVPAIHLLRVESAQIPSYLNVGALEEFMSNAQCVITVMMGFVGGCFARWLCRKRVTVCAGDA